MHLITTFIHTLLANIFCFQVQAHEHHNKRRICTVISNNDPSRDDAPNIRAALQACGDTGTILLEAEHNYYMHSPIDLSPCKRCQIQIDGRLNLGISNLTSDWNYWQEEPFVFTIANTSNVVITSSGEWEQSGTIDAGPHGGCAYGLGAWQRDHGPVLFDISNGSSQIYIRNLKLRDVPCRMFRIRAGSSAVHISNLHNLIAADEAIVVEESQHVYIDNSNIRSIGTCLAVGLNTSNVQMMDSACDAVKHPWRDTSPNAFELRLGSVGGDSLLSNILVKNIAITGRNMNIVGFEDVAQYSSVPQATTINNATFTDIAFGTATPPRQAVFIGPHRGRLVATDVSFRNFVGTNPLHESDLKCQNPEDECTFTREGWSDTGARKA